MNKRSAMLVAAGLVLTLIVGGVAVAVGLTGPASSAAAPRITHKQKARKPIVKTIKRTVTVHKQAPAAAVAAPAVTYTSSAAPTSASYSGSTSSGSSYGEDGGYEDSHSQEPSGEHSSGGGDD